MYIKPVDEALVGGAQRREAVLAGDGRQGAGELAEAAVGGRKRRPARARREDQGPAAARVAAARLAQGLAGRVGGGELTAQREYALQNEQKKIIILILLLHFIYLYKLKYIKKDVFDFFFGN